ncbi:MAG: PepSY-like domain-containing protein [Bacteroidota bacterium]
MLRNHTTLLVRVLAGLMLVTTSIVLAGEKKISKKELPDSVRTAFGKAYPHAKILGTSKEVEEGETLYEIESVDGTTHRDLLYKADGTVVEVEETVALSDLPEHVKATIQKESSGKKISKIEKLIHGQTVEYEIHMVTGKKKHELLVDSEGKVVRPENEKQEGKNPEQK